MKKKIESVKEINMTVIDDTYFLSMYSLKDKPVISSEVADFLENTAREYGPYDKFILNIYSDTIWDEDKSVYRKAVHNYYSLKISDLHQQMRQKLFVAATFMLIGLIGLVMMVIYQRFYSMEVWNQLIQIFSWVFIWESLHIFFIDRRPLFIANRRYVSLANMDINYFKLTKDKKNDQQSQ